MQMRDILDIFEEKYTPLPVIQKAAKDLLQRRIDWGGGAAEMVLWEMGYHPEQTGKNFSDIHKIMRTRKFKAELKNWAIDKCEDAKFKIEQELQNSKYTVYRVITGPENWTPDPNRHPGIYWSFDKEAAEAHWGFVDHKHEYLLTAKIKNSDIDWVSTISANANPSSEDEKEVTLYANSEITFTYEQVKSRWKD